VRALQSQELRLESTGDSKLRWTAGGSYFWESAKQEGGVFIGPQTADQLIWDLQIAPLLGLPYEESVVAGVRVPAFVGTIGGLDAESCAGGAGCVLYPGAGLDFFKNSILSPFRGLAPGSLGGRQLVQQVDYWLDSFKIDGEYRSYAVFGDVSYDLSEMFTLTGGLRYTKDEKEFGRRIEFNPYGVPIAFPEETLIDADGAIAAQVPVNAAPLTLLLDANGMVLDYRVGPFISVAEIAAFADGP
jgi:outer membrane receptor protein involved in Fe transport